MRADGSLTLWFGSVRPFNFEDRLATAVAGGFTAMSVAPMDLRDWEAAGISRRAVGQRVMRAGVRIAAIDPATRWTPTWEPPRDMRASYVAFCDFETDELLDMATQLDCGMLCALELLGNEVDAEAGASAFADLCGRAAERGVRVGLEFLPFTGIPDLTSAWNIVRGAPPNGGLVIDAWHLFRGPDPERDLNLLATIPGERVFAFQLSDAPADAGPDLRVETVTRRALPGDGAFDLGRLVAALRATGANPIVGPEVLAPSLWQLRPSELGPLLAYRTRETLAWP